MKEKIILNNRYNMPVFLEKKNENEYTLVINNNDYYTFNVSKDGENYKYIDPSGGPFLSVGGEIPGTDLIIKNIKYDKDSNYYTIII